LRSRRHVLAFGTFAGVLLVVGGTLVGLGGSDIPAGAAPSDYPVTVTSCGVPVTYMKAPSRAVSNDINTTEDMLALGLESHMVGDFGVKGDGPEGKPIPTPYSAGFHKVRDVSNGYFTLEKLVGLHPDFVFAGWN